MATVIGNGAFRIWTGRRQSGARRTSNIGVLIQERRLPEDIILEDIERVLASRIEDLIRELYPWSS